MRSSLSSIHDAVLTTPFNHNVHHHGHCAAAACGSLKPLPVERLRGTCPHLSYSMKFALLLGTTEGPTLIGQTVTHVFALSSFSCSWRTITVRPECDRSHVGEGLALPDRADALGISIIWFLISKALYQISAASELIQRALSQASKQLRQPVLPC